MPINADHKLTVNIVTASLQWQWTTQVGIQIRTLEQNDTEASRLTAIIQYLPGTQNIRQCHPHGEEIFVLEGTLQDEFGDYPAGTYLKNPPGFSHQPFSQTGCIIFAKLNYLQNQDHQRTVINTADMAWLPGLVEGLKVLPLSEFQGKHTALVRWQPGTQFQPHRHYGGEEILVLKGMFQDEHGDYAQGVWLRSPHLSHHQPYSEPGCTILVKVGHLDID